LEKIASRMQLPIRLVDSLSEAEFLLTSKNYYQKRSQVIRDAEAARLPIYVIKSNAAAQIEQGLAEAFGNRGQGRAITTALREAEEAIREVEKEGQAVELSPQNSFIRRLQHQLAGKYSLHTESTGKEPQRRVRIFKG
jgi:hypothetical protein